MRRVVILNGRVVKITINGLPNYRDESLRRDAETLAFEGVLAAVGTDRYGPGWARQVENDSYVWEPF